MEQSWAVMRIRGWGAYVLKEKLKGLRGNLKIWNKEVFGNLKTQKEVVVQQINALDLKEEEYSLSEDKIRLRHELIVEFWKVLKLHESLLC